MSGDFLHDQAKGLVEKFFIEENSRVLAKYREKLEKESRLEELAKATGITNPATIGALVDLGINGVTIAALTLYPLVAVAWADGALDESERKAVLDAAKAKGMQADSPSFAILESWLKQAPKSALKDAWKSYVQQLCTALDAKQRASLQVDILSQARKVAESAGGFLGLGSKISAQESSLLAELEKVFKY
jgi:hypothetical protein